MPISLDGARPAAPLASPAIVGKAPEPRAEPERFEQLMRRLAHEIDRGEAVVRRGEHVHYAGLDAAQLIALQAGIYRYSEAVDLVVKLVDRAATATKTILESGR
jgi:hypothetical protein